MRAGDLDGLMARKPKAQAITILPPEDSEPSWPSTLALEIVLAGKVPQGPCEKYGITEEAYRAFDLDPRFVKELAEAETALLKPNARFKAKAAIYSEEMIDVLRSMAKNSNVTANVRGDNAKTIIKIAGLDASENKASNTPGLSININLA